MKALTVVAVASACSWIGSIVVAGCATTNPCAPNAQNVCACADGTTHGVQTCLDDGSGYTACEGCPETSGATCAGPLTTLQNCGACGAECSPLHAKGATCEKGGCDYAECVGDFVDCDGDVANGCETDPHVDPDHCGGCNRSCATAGVEHVTGRACLNGACDYVTCGPLYADCDGDRTNGCERPANTLTDCGGCDLACEPENSIAPSCVTGTCDMAGCRNGFSDCDGDIANGCESAVLSDTKNCGACATVCESGEGCLAGKCGVVGKSCADILSLGGSTGTGVYPIDPNGGSHADAFDVFCDMTTDGGGWTFVAGLVPTDGNRADWFHSAFWLNATELGDFASERFSADFKSRAAWLVSGSAIMIQVASGPEPLDVFGFRGWAMTKKTYHSFFSQPRNTVLTEGTLFSQTALVHAWEPLLKFGQELVANRVDNPNGDGTRLGVTGRPFMADDNQPGLGTAMNLDCCGPDHRHAEVELQWNTSENIWCSSVGGDGTFKWLGTDSACGNSCGNCENQAGPGYSPAWNYRFYVR